MSPAEARLKQVPSGMTDAEWNQRVNLAAAYRLVALFGWDDLVDTHISARVPGPDHHFLINPYGLLFEEITASSLIRVDLAGNQLSESPYRINPAGFTIHSAIHQVRDEVIEKNTRLHDNAERAELRSTQLVWPPLLRKLDRKDPSYKT